VCRWRFGRYADTHRSRTEKNVRSGGRVLTAKATNLGIVPVSRIAANFTMNKCETDDDGRYLQNRDEVLALFPTHLSCHLHTRDQVASAAGAYEETVVLD
jgi:hypothetical protein